MTECLHNLKEWSNSDFITYLSTVEEKNEGVPLKDLIVAAKGFEPANKNIFIKLATKKKRKQKEANGLKVYTNKRNTKNIYWDPDDSDDILFVPTGIVFRKK